MRFMYQYPEMSGLAADMLDAGPVAYTDRSLHDAGADFGRHRAAIEELGEAGATWVIVPGRPGDPAAFIERFGKEVTRP